MENNNIFLWSDLFDAQEIDLFNKSCEKAFRDSWEYKLWLSTTERNICAACGESVYEDNIKVEVHHFKRTLFDWADLITNRMIDNGLLVNSCYICQILSDIHLNRCVSYLPLSKTYHDQLHNYKRQYLNGEEMFMEKYPNAINYVYHGNFALADDIINKHIEILKTISGSNNND